MPATKSSFSRLAKRYASALFSLAQEHKLVEKVQEDLVTLHGHIESNKDLQQLVRNPVLARSQVKAALTRVALTSDAAPLTQRFLGTLADNRRLMIIPAVIESYAALLSEERGEVVVRLVTAAEMNEKKKQEIALKLGESTGKKIIINEEIDETILGGFIVYMGSQMIDHSLNGQLERLRLFQKRAAMPA